MILLTLIALAQDEANGDYGGYHTWPEIRAIVDGWKRERPALVHEISIGKTLEGREIAALKISDNAAKDEEEPELLLMAGIHAREQPAQVLLVRLVQELLDGYGRDDRLTRLVNERELWVIPVLNVDGKVYDMKHGNGTDRGAEWRKNRRPNPDGTFGVDLNRQFPVRWGGSTGVRFTPAGPGSDYFVGWGPAEEPEVRALEEFFRRRPLRLFIDIHSPFGSINLPGFPAPSEHERLTGLAAQMRALQEKPYTLAAPGGEPPLERGGDSGLSNEWAHHLHGVAAMIFEVRADPKWYPPMEQIDGEWANFREPMLLAIEEAGAMPLRREGKAKMKEATTDRTAVPGARVVWSPRIEGPCEYGVLISRSAAVRVTSETRRFPLQSGFVLRVTAGAKPGTKVPLTLVLWDAERGRSLVETELAIVAPAGKRKVAIYDFGAEGGAGVTNLKECLPDDDVRVVNAAEIRDGVLKGVQVLMVPGGSGSAQSKELEEKGRAEIRGFVERGGGYVGFCAGAYLASTHYPWSLGILDAKVIDTEHWARGTGTVRIGLTSEGRSLLGVGPEVEVYYGQGPLLGPGEKAEVPDFAPLATYLTEIAKNGAPEGVMKGTVAVATGSFGKGRVFCFSPHPEKTVGLEPLVERAVTWAGGF